MDYIINSQANVSYKGKKLLSANNIVKAIHVANDAICKLNIASQGLEDNVFEILGMRNLSGLVGEFFARSVMKVSNGRLQSNLHQDGYPDLCLTATEAQKKYFESLYSEENGRKHPISKEVFSPYKYGGIEIKATCGSIPPSRPKTLVGEQRISLITKLDWKAHHRETNHLLAILWDFIDNNPTIVAAFYQDELIEDDWGRTVVPKTKEEGGGRTTSVSIMNARGIRKMCNNWIAVIDDANYIDLLAKKSFIGYKVK